jgi:hypothetical protein
MSIILFTQDFKGFNQTVFSVVYEVLMLFPDLWRFALKEDQTPYKASSLLGGGGDYNGLIYGVSLNGILKYNSLDSLLM